MGYGSWKESTWSSYKTTSGINTARSTADIYKTTRTKDKYLPYNVMRESCDSDEHPNSTPIILGLDVTGSMGHLLSIMAKKLGTTVGEIYNRNVVTDPQVCFAAIDDFITSGNESLQVTQFEADIKIAEQLTELKFIERGGGNGWESYALAWYFAAYHTKCDAIAKGRKGIIITMGDDGVQPELSKEEIKRVFGDNIKDDISTHALLNKLSRDWEVFHLNIVEGSSYSTKLDTVWKEYLGDNVIKVENVDKIPEIIVSLLQKLRGDTLDEIAQSWDGSTGLVVKDALKGLELAKADKDNGIVLF